MIHKTSSTIQQFNKLPIIKSSMFWTILILIQNFGIYQLSLAYYETWTTKLKFSNFISKKKTIVNLDLYFLFVVHVLNDLLLLLSTYFSNVDNPFAQKKFPFFNLSLLTHIKIIKSTITNLCHDLQMTNQKVIN